MEIKKHLNIKLILILGLIIRLLFLWWKPGIMTPDSTTYLEAGHHFYNNLEIISPKIMPLFPILVGLFSSAIYFKIFNVLLSTLNIFLCYKLAKKTFNNKSALIAATVSACYPFYIYLGATILTETIYSTLLLLIFVLYSYRKYVLGHTAILISILIRPTLEPFSLILLGSFLYINKESRTTSIRQIAYFIAIYVALMTPWWVHNYNKYDQFVRLAPASGVSFYIGNHISTEGRAGWFLDSKGEDTKTPPFPDLNAIERDQKLKEITFSTMKKYPFRFMGVFVKKLFRMWKPFPDPSGFGGKKLYFYASLLTFGPILVFFLLFVFIHLKRDWKIVLPFLLTLGYFTTVHCLIIANIRYRLPLDYFVIIIAAQSAVIIYSQIRKPTNASCSNTLL